MIDPSIALEVAARLSPPEDFGFYSSARWLRYCLSRSDSQLLVVDHQQSAFCLADLSDGHGLGLVDVARFVPPEKKSDVTPAAVVASSGATSFVQLPDPQDGGAPATVFEQLAELADSRTIAVLYLRAREMADTCAIALGLDDQAVFISTYEALLEAEYDTFNDYVRHVKPSRRAGVAKERRVFVDRGLQVDVLRGSQVGLEVASLQANFRAHHGMAGGSDAIQHDFDLLTRALGDDFIAFVARDGSAPLASLVGMIDGETFYARAVGFHDSLIERPADLYFNIAYYEPIVWGLSHGVHRFHFGTGTYGVKRNRGCMLRPLWAAVRWPDGLQDELQTAARTRGNQLLDDLP